MREKLLNLMKSEGLTSSRLAEILEIQPSGISHILSGRNKPGFDLLQKILRRFPRINPDWLLLDSDQMYRPDSAPSTPDDRMQSGSPSEENLFSNVAAPGQTVSAATPTPDKAIPLSAVPLSDRTVATQADVERIVVFLRDGTFESYAPKK